MSVLAVLSRARLASAFSLSSTRIARSGHHATRLVALAPLPQTRSYAKASKKSKGKGKQVEEEPEEEPEDFSHSQKGAKRKKVSTDDLVPASQRIVASKEYKDAESKMETALAWFRREVSAAETRATGRVTPAILEPVRVRSRDGPSVRLEEVATVGVRDGTMLLVTVFEESMLKGIEQAIYEAKIQGATPQRLDSRTLKIPISKPTVETRKALFSATANHAETVRTQLRTHHQALLKKMDITKRSADFSTYQGLLDKCIGELDKMLAQLKKGMS